MGVYGPLIAGVNLVLLISSTVLIYLGSVLIHFYLLPNLYFVTSNFSAVPNLMLAVGVMGLMAGLVGITVGATASRGGLIVHSVLVAFIFIVQLASIFTTFELRSELNNEILGKIPETDIMSDYFTYQSSQDSWDNVQRTYSCCGLNGQNNGYWTWKQARGRQVNNRANNGVKVIDVNSVPDSCCVNEMEGCGKNINDKSTENACKDIFTHGCLYILQGRMKRDIMPVLLAYLGCGVILAILQIVAIVLSAAYSAALARRARREEERYAAVKQGPVESKYHFTDPKATAPYPTLPGSHNGSLRSKKSFYEDDISLQKTEYMQRSSLHIEPSDEKGTVI